MSSLLYSFAQLEAFTAVVEHGSLMQAAIRLGKDRTTLRDLIDFLEDGLGYPLFIREGRTLRLTPEGEQLQRQAHLLMRQVKAFEAFARNVPDGASQQVTLVYDPFTPRAFLRALIGVMADRGTRLSLIGASRDVAEDLLAKGQADLGIFQARNRSVGNEMEWRALGAIDMDFYASTALFPRDRAAAVAARSLAGAAGDHALRIRRARGASAANFRSYPVYQRAGNAA